MKTEIVTIQDIQMVRGSGYGQYSIKVKFEAYGDNHEASFHSTDSRLWDNEERTDEDLLRHIGGEDALLSTIDWPAN